jgi:hypothetical protein
MSQSARADFDRMTTLLVLEVAPPMPSVSSRHVVW